MTALARKKKKQGDKEERRNGGFHFTAPSLLPSL
jgi:hypothetical protein